MRATIIAALAMVAAAAPGKPAGAAAAPAATVTEVVDVTLYVWEDGTPVETEAPKADYGGKPDYGNYEPAPAPAPAAPEPAPYVPAPESEPAPKAPGSYPGAGQSTPSSYSDAVVAHHNAHRANHSAPALSWDPQLASIAEQIASSCVYAHDT
jgi:uncharacterized protein YkwD